MLKITGITARLEQRMFYSVRKSELIVEKSGLIIMSCVQLGEVSVNTFSSTIVGTRCLIDNVEAKHDILSYQSRSAR